MKLRQTVFIILLSLLSCKADDEKRHGSIFPEEVELRTGDIVLRRGTGFTSRAVLFADKGGQYSHVGIVVGSEGKWMVVHAVPGEPDYTGDEDRVKIEPVTRYFMYDRASSGCVLRSNDSLAAANAANHALRLYQRGTLFDHQYDDTDTMKMYCSELVEFAYHKAGLSLVGSGSHDIHFPGMWLRHVVLPSDFLSSPYVRELVSF